METYVTFSSVHAISIIWSISISLYEVLLLNKWWAIWIWCERFEFDVRDLNSMWAIWIWWERFEFDVSDLNLMWAIWIWCEQFEFDASDLNLMWAIWIWCLNNYRCCTCGPREWNSLAWNLKPFGMKPETIPDTNCGYYPKAHCALKLNKSRFFLGYNKYILIY